MTLVKSSLLLCFVEVSLLLLVHCDCLQIQPASLRFRQGKEYEDVRVSVVKLLPRKLQVLAGEVTVIVSESAEKDSPSKSYSPEKKILHDELEWEKASAVAAKEHLGRGQTWKQRMDTGGDSSEFFTMDYSRVRRRRPIHNKSLPVGP